MWSTLSIVLILCYCHNGKCQDADATSLGTKDELKLSQLITMILDHYKKPDPVGFPGAQIPDPYHIPEMKRKLALGGSIAFINSTLFGISQIRVLYVNVEASKMEATAVLSIDRVHAKGKYILSTWLRTYPGFYKCDVEGIKALATASLGVDRDGRLKVQNITMDITFDKIDVQFENSGLLSFLLQGLFNSMGVFLFNSIKPYILKDAYTKVREEINKRLDAVDLQFPNSISPVDMILINARNKVISLEKDPYRVKDFKSSVSIFNVVLTETIISGLCSFYRDGNTTLKMENNTLIINLNIGTQEMEGSANWEISTFRGYLSRMGNVNFLINYVHIQIIIEQSLDMRKSPQFRRLNVELGNLQIRFDGAGTIDYIIELAINILPNLLRNQIIIAVEDVIRLKIQRELDEVHVEDIFKEFLPIVDQIQFKELNFSMLFLADKIRYDEDDFFNF